MNIIPGPLQGATSKDQSSLEEHADSILLNQHEINIADGGEFINDEIRMIDQPLGEKAIKKEE